jgi:predicted transcriptional regulator
VVQVRVVGFRLSVVGGRLLIPYPSSLIPHPYPLSPSSEFHATIPPTMTEAERIDRFEAAYNRIDRALAESLNEGDRRKNGFAAKVRLAASRRRHLSKYKDFLIEIGELRNALVHNRFGDEHFLAVPSEDTVLELEKIEKLAFSPERVVPRFAREVIALRADESIAEAWQRMRDDGYSRYPVYDKLGESGNFIGLLTSNGLARWVASQLQGTKLNLDTAKVRVADVLARDHRREQVVFVSRDALIDAVDDMFRQSNPLEAVIITEHGKPHEKPLGMICANDVAGLNR